MSAQGPARGRASSRGSRPAARIRDIYQDVGPPRESRARPRLAHRHARRREGARGALRAAARGRPASRWSTSPAACRRRSPAIASGTSLVQRLPLVDGSTATTCRSSRLPSNSSTSTTSTWSSARAIAPPRRSCRRPGARHLCYCFTPMRYAWDQFDHYFGPAGRGGGEHAARPVLARLARWDRGTASRVDRYVAISHYVAGRIRRYYNRRV